MEPNINQENMNSPVQPTPPIMPKPFDKLRAGQKKQISTWVGILIIVLFTGIVFGGVFAWQYFLISKQASENKNIQNSLSSATKAPFSWYGAYQFEESAPPNEDWMYKFSIVDGADGHVYTYVNIDGFQTLTRINAAVAIKDSTSPMDIIFDSYGADNTDKQFKKGDVLFTVTPMPSGDLSIQWKKMQPNLEKNINVSVFKRENKTNTIDQTAGWKIYSDEKYGFTFKYPLKWGDISTQEDGNFMPTIRITQKQTCFDLTPECNSTSQLEIATQKGYTLDDIAKNNQSYQKTNINGFPAVFNTFVSGRVARPTDQEPYGFYKGYNIYIEKPNKILVTIAFSSPLFAKESEAQAFDIADFQGFLSTFKFTK